MLNYCIVKQRIGAITEDSLDDDDRYPDYTSVFGEVSFKSTMATGSAYKITDDGGVVHTVPALRITAQIINGEIMHEGLPGVPLFAAGPNANPSTIVYTATYNNLTAAGRPIKLNNITFRAVPGETIDLSSYTPVAGAPVPGIVQGPAGHTPYIGENGNWWINGKDTGVVATSPMAHSYAELKEAYEENTVRVRSLEVMTGVGPESPVDGQTANLLTQPDTLTRAAAKGFTEPIVCSLQPTSLRSVAETTEGSIYPLEVFDGYMWGFTLGGGIHRQPVAGGAWTLYAQAPVPSTVIRILPTGDGEVLIASARQVHKSEGWATGSPTWTLKVTANDTTNILRGGIAGSGQKFIVTSYASGAGFPESRYVYISLDAGNTWTIKYDSVEIHGQVAADQSHVHAVEYDPWSDRFYVSEGHSNAGDISGLWASDDDGGTWYRAEGMKKDPAPVTVTATNDGLVCGSDSRDNGLFGVLRAPIPEEEMHLVAEWKTGALGLNGFARHAFREPETGLVYVAFRSNHPDVNPVIMAGSPLTGAVVYEFSPPERTIQDRIESVVVPTPDRLFAHAISGPGTYTIISGKLGHPTARSVEDPGNILGGDAGSNDSVVVGRMASSGLALRSVVIGRGANLSPDTNDQESVLIGESATSSGTNVVAIGRGVAGTSYSVVIGSGANPGSVNSTVMVGYMTSVSGGGQNVAIGRRATARAQSVSIGDTATSVSSSSKATSIGYASKAGSESVAVGASTSSGISLRSVVIGAGANLSDTTGTQNHVVIGQAATSIGADSVVVGQGATGAEASVIIGKSASSTYPSVVLIGQGATIDGGGNAVAVGLGTFARHSSTAIGTRAASVEASARTVSVGYEAKSHTDSVALGASTETTQSFQVAVGARSLFIQDRAVAPAAPADGGQLYARDGSLYWINSSGVYTKIAPVDAPTP